MTNGMTYIVRPRMHPRYRSVMMAFISFGSIQLLVGPASFSSTLQMKVRSSTRATSVGSVRAQKEFGFFSALSRVKVPLATSASVSSVHSSSEPVHQCTWSGWVSSAISETQDAMPLCDVGAVSLLVSVVVMLTGVLSRRRAQWCRSPEPRTATVLRRRWRVSWS